MAKNSDRSARGEAARQVLEAEKKRRRRNTIIQVLVVTVVVAAVIGGTVLALRSSDSTTAAGAAASAPSAVTPDGSYVVGSPDAPVTVQVVEDFQCPVCQQFETAFGETLDEYAQGTDVKVEYRGIAFLDRASTTNYSSRALNASACVMEAGDTDVWKEFHRQMYLQQPAEGGAGLPNSQIVSIASAAGADDISSCVDDDTYADWVTATTKASSDDDVTGTPTVFVNGTKLDGFAPADVQAAVDEALAS